MPHASSLLAQVAAAAEQKLLAPAAAANLHRWLTEARYADYRTAIGKLIVQGDWAALNDAFWTAIPFGTAGRRGQMFPVGPNSYQRPDDGRKRSGLGGVR